MKNVDARIVSTKKFLREALITLLSQKKISEIKVVTLCNCAEINRATFYSHYKDVYELFEEIIDEFMNDICETICKINIASSKEEKKELFIQFINKIDNNSDLFVMIFENSSNIEFSSAQYQELNNKIHQRIINDDDKNHLSSYLTNYYIYSGGAILYTWIKNGKVESRQEISGILYAFINKGASYFIKH